MAGMPIYIYVIWLKHHGNRLCGVMGLRSKMSDWMEWMDGVEWVIPLRLLRLLEHLRC